MMMTSRWWRHDDDVTMMTSWRWRHGDDVTMASRARRSVGGDRAGIDRHQTSECTDSWSARVPADWSVDWDRKRRTPTADYSLNIEHHTQSTSSHWLACSKILEKGLMSLPSGRDMHWDSMLGSGDLAQAAPPRSASWLERKRVRRSMLHLTVENCLFAMVVML